jgi:hypothetical protein
MVVSESIFKGNGNLKDLGLRNAAISKFAVSNCVFSDSLPSDSYAIFISSNPSFSTTASYPLFAMMTAYCPGIPLQTITSSPLPTVSSSSFPTATVSPPTSSFTYRAAIFNFRRVCLHYGLYTFLLDE